MRTVLQQCFEKEASKRSNLQEEDMNSKTVYNRTFLYRSS